VNDAACVARPATHVQNPQAPVNRKRNHCGHELQRTWLGGTLLRPPQIEPYVEIFAAKFVLDLSLSRDFHRLLSSFAARKCTDTSLSYANSDESWKNLTVIDGGCLLVASPLEEFERAQSGERLGLIVVAAAVQTLRKGDHYILVLLHADSRFARQGLRM
jgi:hypothetical protein